MTKDTYDFWTLFDNFCVSLRQADKHTVADKLKEIQKYANGMTDGWFDFLNAFDKAIKDNVTILSKEEKNIAGDLLLKLKSHLTK